MKRYEFISSEEINGLSKIYKDGKWGILNKETLEEVVAPSWDREPEFCKDFIIFYDKMGYGAINKEGKTILPGKYYEVKPITERIIRVKTFLCFYGLFDADGNEILPYIYQDIDYIDDDIILVQPQNKMGGIMNIKGEEIIPFEYERIIYSRAHRKIIAAKDGKYGAITSLGKEIIPFEYDKISFCDSFYIVQKGKYVGLHDSSGKEIIPATKYNKISVDYNNLYTVSINEKYGLVSGDGTEIVECIYDYIQDIGYEHFKVSKIVKKPNASDEYLWGVINSEGKEIIPCIYDNIRNFNGETFIITKRFCYYGLVNKQNEMLIEPKYTILNHCEESDYVTIGYLERSNPLYGLFNSKGEQVLPIMYDMLSLKDNVAYVKYNGKNGIVLL